jgi:FixJ family two-component response regulator
LPTVVHVVDDDASYRTAIARILRAAGYEVVAYECAQQLLDRLPTDNASSCLLLDVKIPGVSGPELQRQLAQLGCALPVVFLTGHGDIPTSVQAIKAGAEDFLTKPVSKTTLIDAIERAVARHQAEREQYGQLDSMRARIAKLTPREREVFELVVQGRMNKQIAFALGTTERTIKAHRHKVMEKIGVQSLAQLVLVAERLGVFANHPNAGQVPAISSERDQ